MGDNSRAYGYNSKGDGDRICLLYTSDVYKRQIIGMDDRNIEDLMERAPDLETEKKIHRMTDYCRTKVADYVPDPCLLYTSPTGQGN